MDLPMRSAFRPTSSVFTERSHIGTYSLQAILHPEAHEDGGFGFTNKELLARQRGVMTDIIKEVIPL